jgi:hypothetical protein
MILEDEAALPPAPKEAVSVAFICNLRRFGCPLSADTISLSQWYIDREFPKEERKLVAGGVYYAGSWLSNGRHTIENNRNGRSA